MIAANTANTSETLEPQICVYLFEKTQFMLDKEILDEVLLAHK